MRVSELQPAAYPQSPSVELPNQDAHRLFTNDFNEKYKFWAVPEFAEGRAEYCKVKQAYCDVWGCE